MRSIAAYRLLLGLALAVFGFDQASKLWIAYLLPLGSFHPPNCIEIIPGFFNLVHVGNTGAAWSLFTGQSVLLAAIGGLALLLIFFFRKSLKLKEIKTQWIFGLITGGIVGNVFDRIRLGYVVDFLDFHFKEYYWPSFNIADSAITVGVALYAIGSFFERNSRPEKKTN